MALERRWGVIVDILFVIVSPTLPFPELELYRGFLRMSQRREQDIGAGEGY
jgi:hypothetical protein